MKANGSLQCRNHWLNHLYGEVLNTKTEKEAEKKNSHACSIKYILHENFHLICNFDVSLNSMLASERTLSGLAQHPSFS